LLIQTIGFLEASSNSVSFPTISENEFCLLLSLYEEYSYKEENYDEMCKNNDTQSSQDTSDSKDVAKNQCAHDHQEKIKVDSKRVFEDVHIFLQLPAECSKNTFIVVGERMSSLVSILQFVHLYMDVKFFDHVLLFLCKFIMLNCEFITMATISHLC
jgi:hypothetical protein